MRYCLKRIHNLVVNPLEMVKVFIICVLEVDIEEGFSCAEKLLNVGNESVSCVFILNRELSLGHIAVIAVHD